MVQADFAKMAEEICVELGPASFLADSTPEFFSSRLAKDPWGNEYFFSQLDWNDRPALLVWTFGSDQKPGGEIAHQIDQFTYLEFGNCITNH